MATRAPQLGPHRKHLTLPVPTQADFDQYKGGHTHKKWVVVGPDWCCPSCRRAKFEQLTWTQRRTQNGRVATGEYAWLAPIIAHHDHGATGLRAPRFPPTYLCFDCNIAEGRAKRMLKLPPDFSFSPQELACFVTGYPHRRVTENLEVAERIAVAILAFRF
jgi:hypothetical protein